MDEVGFKYEYNFQIDFWGYVGGVVLLMLDGCVLWYFYGVDYVFKDLCFGFIEVLDGKIGLLVDQVFLFCYKYDFMSGKYSVYVLNFI